MSAATPPAKASILPTLDDVVARYPRAATAEVNEAVEAAQRRIPGWSRSLARSALGPARQGRLADHGRAKELGALLSREEGKTLPEGTGEVMRAGAHLQIFRGRGAAPSRRDAGVHAARRSRSQTYREPVGVFGLITPWNFPIAIPGVEERAGAGLRQHGGDEARLADAGHGARAWPRSSHEAGAPQGVFNLVIGGGDVGRAHRRSSGRRRHFVHRSQSVGAQRRRGAHAKRQARVQLEMGGKNPLVVLDDADLDRAVQCALDGAFFATGQRCTASSRIIVHAKASTTTSSKRWPNARRRSRSATRSIRRTQMGPAVSEQQLEQNLRYVDIATEEGGRFVAGGEPLELDKPGYYVAPTLIADTAAATCASTARKSSARSPRTVRVKDYEEALEIANGGEFGLSAGIVTNSLKYARHFRRNVRAGMVMINLPTAGVDYHVPFGGTRKSSYGAREQGFAAVEFYTQIKTSYIWS